MRILIEIIAGENATFADIEETLNRLHETACTAAKANAEHTTTEFANNPCKCCIDMDRSAIATLRMDAEHAQQTIADGYPCHKCVDEGICMWTCDKLKTYERAKRTIEQSASAKGGGSIKAHNK